MFVFVTHLSHTYTFVLREISDTYTLLHMYLYLYTNTGKLLLLTRTWQAGEVQEGDLGEQKEEPKGGRGNTRRASTEMHE